MFMANRARGAERESQVSALDEGKRLVLTSTQGGVTAIYDYRLVPTANGTQITLDAACNATGWWKLVHPLIAFAMKKADSPQLARLKSVVENNNEAPQEASPNHA